ncbi:MAG TPA: 3-hydroxyacyl-CoA dehydrogenase family protein [Candidatus Polarisedimenticolaceae bacterium]|nr:3-hydroxyacyl-CoA dehydrogenase family protein [Candidatus Polarisedimenticolaceae bacterium]
MEGAVDVERVAVIGTGTMGRGIAHVAAAAGMTVRLHDVGPDLVEKALLEVREALDQGVARGKVEPAVREGALARLHPAARLEDAVGDADLVVEAIPESLELKRALFARLDAAAPAAAVLATNTSSLPVASIAAATRRAARVVGMHFFNPVHLMPLLEVVRAEGTASEVVDVAVHTGRRMGKEPIVVRDSPGFASSRLGVVLGLEAIRMVEEQVASPEDIDKAMTLGYRHPMGPLRLTDLVGLDVRLAIAEHLHRELKSEAFRPPALMRRMVEEGKLGKKAGQGFYRWDESGA